MAARWHGLQSKPGKEAFLSGQLLARGFGVFYPHIRVQSVNPRARKVKPYFPGNIYVNADLKENNLFTLHLIPGAKGAGDFW